MAFNQTAEAVIWIGALAFPTFLILSLYRLNFTAAAAAAAAMRRGFSAGGLEHQQM